MTTIGFKTNDGVCSGSITMKNEMTVIVTGVIPSARGLVGQYIASAPIDRRQSHAGSALPWPNQEMALGNTTNKGRVSFGNNGEFSISLVRPNSYYINNGRTLVDPVLIINVGQNEVNVPLPVTVKNRTLTSSIQVRSTGRNPVN